MKLAALVIVAIVSAPHPAVSSDPPNPNDITTRVIITNDSGFDPDSLNYINLTAKQRAEQLHRITLLQR